MIAELFSGHGWVFGKTPWPPFADHRLQCNAAPVSGQTE